MAQGKFLTVPLSILALALTWHVTLEKSHLLSELQSGVTVAKLGHLGQHRGVDTPVRFRGFLGVLYLDEVGCRHPPLLEVLLTVLLLHLQGKARAKDALGEEALLGERGGGGRQEEKVSTPAPLSSPLPHPCKSRRGAKQALPPGPSPPPAPRPPPGDPKCRGTHGRQGKEGDA